MKKNIFRISMVMILFFVMADIKVFAKEVLIKEKVVDFNLEMNINTDSSVDITESFTFVSTENMKEYVTKRSLPVEYNGRKIEIKNIKVSENGKNIDINIDRKDRNIVINLSGKNQELSLGVHTYNIKYTVNNLIEFNKENKIRWHLFSDSFGIPINNCNIKIKFPNGTEIKKDKFKVRTITNSLERENVNIPVKFSDEYIEYYDNYLIYPGTDIIVECSFTNAEMTKPTFLDSIIKFLSRNLISIIILILTIVLCVYEKYSIKNIEKQEDVKLKLLIMIASVIFTFIIAILVGMNMNYNITMNYMKNVFIKFLSLLMFEGIVSIVTYFSIRYELFENNKVNQIISIVVIVSIVSVGMIYVTNFLEDMYYNMFGYLVLLFVLLSNMKYVYKLERKKFD